jgi:hypothetical protein
MNETLTQGDLVLIMPESKPPLQENTVLPVEPVEGKWVFQREGGEPHTLPEADAEVYTAKRVSGRQRLTCLEVMRSTYITQGDDKKKRLLVEPGFYFVDLRKG